MCLVLPPKDLELLVMHHIPGQLSEVPRGDHQIVDEAGDRGRLLGEPARAIGAGATPALKGATAPHRSDLATGR